MRGFRKRVQVANPGRVALVVGDDLDDEVPPPAKPAAKAKKPAPVKIDRELLEKALKNRNGGTQTPGQ